MGGGTDSCESATCASVSMNPTGLAETEFAPPPAKVSQLLEAPVLVTRHESRTQKGPISITAVFSKTEAYKSLDIEKPGNSTS